MELRGCPVLLLLVAVCSGSSSHSLRYFHTGVSEPSQGLPQFITVGYVDDQPIDRYDSDTKRDVPVVPWMKKVENYDAQYWDRQTQIVHGLEQTFRASVEIVRNYYNQSKGFHSLQCMYGCELRRDESKWGYFQFGYDGRDYISLDKETLTWTADIGAQNTKRKWEAERAIAQRLKGYLEEECIEWLQRYLGYGNETLLRTEPPKVKVTRKAGYDDTETLTCRADGFYPKEIDMAWTRDGEVWTQDTFRGVVAPNSDGTYHSWLGIKVDPKQRERYQCRVEHNSLPEPVDFAWEEPASNMGLIIGCVVGAILLVAAIAGISVYIKKRQDGYKAASTSDRSSDGSSKA